MNKKVLTLCAGALLASSLDVVAQYSPAQIDYRSRLVKSAKLDATFSAVKEINQEYYYQLQVDPKTLGWTENEKTPTFVLTAERDYSTGKIYLTAQEITKATLTHSLWKITVTDRSANGRVYTYENLETGYVLAFDHTNALQRNGDKKFIIPSVYDENDKNKANFGWTYEKDGLTDGCIDNWAWYTTDEVASELGYKKVFSYFHNQTDSVMALHAVREFSTGDDGFTAIADKVYDERVVAGLSDNTGLTGTSAGGYAIVAVKDSKANADDFVKSETHALGIKPVIAGAKVLNAADINAMIDADNSWLTFTPHIREYNNWSDAANESKRLGKWAKFTVLDPDSKKELNLIDNPFAIGNFVAESIDEYNLHRGQYDANNTLIGNGNNKYAGYDILLRKEKANEGVYDYLYVHEHVYEPKTATDNHDGLKVALQPYAYLTDAENGGERRYLKQAAQTNSKAYPDALEARYHWKVTYYASNDSLVLEPLNASRMNTEEMNAETPFEESHLATEASAEWVNTVNDANAYNTINTVTNGNRFAAKAQGVPVALFAMNNSLVGDNAQLLTVGTPANVNETEPKYAATVKNDVANPAYVTNGVKDETTPYYADMNLHLTFVNEYGYLIRATQENGLYFMNLVNPGSATAQTEHRVDGAYIVEDMKGHVIYDVEEVDQQDFTHMPATQWVVEQLSCVQAEGDDVNANETPVVRIWNREFNGKAAVNWRPVFEGQLYTTGEGKMFTINYRDYAFPQMWSEENVNSHYRRIYNAADTVKFTKVDPQTILGYFNADEDDLRNNTFMFQHMYDMSTTKFLSISDTKSEGGFKLLKLSDEGTEFELFRSEGWMPVEDSIKVWNDKTNEWEKEFAGTYSFEYVDSLAYGYASEDANVKQLYKTFYKVKVKDANLIDNDHTFMAIDNQHKYVVATEKEIEDVDNHLTYAIVTLKENNCLNGEHGYAIVNSPAYVKVNAKTAEDLKGLTWTVEEDEFGNSYDTYSKGDKVMVEKVRSAEQVDGKLAIESISLNAKIADLCETTTDAFAMVSAERRLYRDLSAEYADLINNEKKVINIIGVDEQSNEFLFEDSNSKPGMNYLGIENKTDLTSNEGFYVDKVAKSTKVMPQYLFAVAADSVPAYTYCNCDIDGHSQHGINAGCGHAETYPGYVEGRFLINFNDSINKALIDKETNADKYKSSVYTRLGFVEAIHRGDYLYVLTNGRTLASLKMEAKDGSGMKYICPDSLAKDQEGKIYTLVELNGKHNNAAFSLRNTGDADNTFMLESNDTPMGVKGYSQVGSFAGAWVKVINGVPVLAKYWNDNGNHNTGDTTDSWFEMGDYTDASDVTGEFINQGARFTFEAIEKDANATANEEIATSSVVVTGTNGAVVVKGAEGKNVIVSTILGKVVANEVVSSDNATIAAPQGVVVVSVDGESFKVVVK